MALLRLLLALLIIFSSPCKVTALEGDSDKVGLDYSSKSSETGTSTNVTTATITTLPIVIWKWHHVETPYLVALWILTCWLCKLGKLSSITMLIFFSSTMLVNYKQQRTIRIHPLSAHKIWLWSWLSKIQLEECWLKFAQMFAKGCIYIVKECFKVFFVTILYQIVFHPIWQSELVCSPLKFLMQKI